MICTHYAAKVSCLSLDDATISNKIAKDLGHWREILKVNLATNLAHQYSQRNLVFSRSKGFLGCKKITRQLLFSKNMYQILNINIWHLWEGYFESGSLKFWGFNQSVSGLILEYLAYPVEKKLDALNIFALNFGKIFAGTVQGTFNFCTDYSKRSALFHRKLASNVLFASCSEQKSICVIKLGECIIIFLL